MCREETTETNAPHSREKRTSSQLKEGSENEADNRPQPKRRGGRERGRRMQRREHQQRLRPPPFSVRRISTRAVFSATLCPISAWVPRLLACTTKRSWCTGLTRTRVNVYVYRGQQRTPDTRAFVMSRTFLDACACVDLTRKIPGGVLLVPFSGCIIQTLPLQLSGCLSSSPPSLRGTRSFFHKRRTHETAGRGAVILGLSFFCDLLLPR